MDAAKPLVSVVMPVYNAASFLREAIESILNQSFTDFEFIIINDGSSDESKAIIKSYTDSRIVYLENEINSGLAYTLNKGIETARGRWIVRMDGDDIALPHRFEKQLAFAAQNPNARIIATNIELINEQNEKSGQWSDDIKHISPESIRRFLPVNNCIAHPTVMMDAALLKQYRYNPLQRLAEDYDLWLRLHADGYSIYKLNEPLLLHRMLQTSFTRTTGKNLYFKLMKLKLRFVAEQLKKKKAGRFVFKIFFNSLLDFFLGTGKQLKKIF